MSQDETTRFQTKIYMQSLKMLLDRQINYSDRSASCLDNQSPVFFCFFFLFFFFFFFFF